MSLLALREELLASAPEGSSQHQKKAFAEHWIARVIEAIDDLDRPPDEWESHQLSSAVGSISMRQYAAAAKCIELALAPPEERIESLLGTVAGVAFRIEDLREGLVNVISLAAPNC